MNKSKLFSSIEQSSYEIKKGIHGLKKRTKSAKNYLANQTLEEWSFCKLAAESFEISWGGATKPFFKTHGFVNILEFEDTSFKKSVINKFLTWSDSIEYLDLRQKFKNDQENMKRFELMIHFDQIPISIRNSERWLYDNEKEFYEGFRNQIKIENLFRDRKLIKHAKEFHGVTCSVCNFNFEKFYGIHGKGFIEMHHLIPIKKGPRKTKITDLVPVCSNCHRMIHKGGSMLSIEYLKDLIEESKK